jgi:hypothetical protein
MSTPFWLQTPNPINKRQRTTRDANTTGTVSNMVSQSTGTTVIDSMSVNPPQTGVGSQVQVSSNPCIEINIDLEDGKISEDCSCKASSSSSSSTPNAATPLPIVVNPSSSDRCKDLACKLKNVQKRLTLCQEEQQTLIKMIADLNAQQADIVAKMALNKC